MKTQPIRFSQQVEARQNASRQDWAIIAERERIDAILHANPEIGILGHGAAQRFYISSPHREAKDPATLAALLAGG